MYVHVFIHSPAVCVLLCGKRSAGPPPPPVVVFVLIHRMLCLFVCSQILDVQMYLCTYLVECTGILYQTRYLPTLPKRSGVVCSGVVGRRSNSLRKVGFRVRCVNY